MSSLRISSNSSFFPFVLRVSGFLYLLNKDLTFSCSFLRTTVTFICLYLPIESNRLQLTFLFLWKRASKCSRSDLFQRRDRSSMPSDAARPRDESGTHSVPFQLVRGRNRSALA